MTRVFNCRGCKASRCEGCSEYPYAPEKPETRLEFMTEEKDTPVNVVEVIKNEVSCTSNNEAAVMVPHKWTEEELSLIKAKVAPNCTNSEFELLMYLSNKYGLDPLARQIWAVKFQDQPAQIYAGRDGFMLIAHRSGQFDGIRSDVYRNEDESMKVDENGKPVGAWCEVWRKDCSHSFRSDVLFKEYDQKRNLWISKPSVMIVKVAESTCLRKAFVVSGLYAPEEIQ